MAAVAPNTIQIFTSYLTFKKLNSSEAFKCTSSLFNKVKVSVRNYYGLRADVRFVFGAISPYVTSVFLSRLPGSTQRRPLQHATIDVKLT